MVQGGAKGEFYRRAAVVAALVVAVSVLHYVTHTDRPLLHDLYRRLYYFPVGLAAVWFGVRGGLVAAVAVAAAYAPHILLHWEHQSREVANQFMEVLLYLGFAWAVGHFADRERRLRVQCQVAADRLDRSYHELKEQADQILGIEEQLRRADRLSAIGQLAAGMTHEIRNPLGAIKGTAEILKDDFPPGHPKAEFLQILVRETDRLNRVVEDFLGYSRQGAEEPGAGGADLGTLAGETAALLDAQARKGGVAVDLGVPGELRVRGAPDQLKQVILNLLLNAVQATPRGRRVRVSGERRPGKVPGAEYREVEGELGVLTVEDEGLGIPPGDLARVFDPFFTTKEEGTGLGLAISRRIVEAHGGRLEAENRPEGGARFTLTLPLAPSP